MVIVTGASRGLGKAICDRLSSQGIDVLGVARNVINSSYPIIACDISSSSDVKSLANYLRSGKSPITGLINAAGVASLNLALTTPSSVAERLISTNLLGTIYCCQYIAPLIIRGGSGGSIINFSTIAVALGLKGESIYVASKAGVEGFSRSFAREMAPFNITVNCIAPGPIDTDLLKGVTESQIQKILDRQIFQKKFTPSDVADIVDVLLDSKSKSLSGQIFNIGGV